MSSCGKVIAIWIPPIMPRGPFRYSVGTRVEPPTRKADPLPASHVLARHDDGVWRRAEVLDRYRTRDGRWWAVVTYTAGIGATFIRAEPYDDLRPVPENHDDEQGHAGGAHGEADGQHYAAEQVAFGRSIHDR